MIRENPLLTYCEAKSICNFIVNPQGAIEIHDNTTGCNCKADLGTACGLFVADITGNDRFTIFPNPSSDLISIEVSAFTTPGSLSLMSLNGN